MAIPMHMVGEAPLKLKLGREVRTRCGIVCTPVSPHVRVGIYKMVSESGGDFLGTTRRSVVTCKKCKNLLDIGRIHARGKR